MRVLPSVFGLMALLAFALGGSVEARANLPRVAFSGVSGEKIDDLEDAFTRALAFQDQIELVGPEEWAEAVAELKSDLSTPGGIVAIATERRIAAIVDGHVVRSGGRYELVVRVTSGETGLEVKSWRVRAQKRTKLPSAVESYIWKQLGASIVVLHAPLRPVRVGLLAVEGGEDAVRQAVVDELAKQSGLGLVAIESEALALTSPDGRRRKALELGLGALLQLTFEQRLGRIIVTGTVYDGKDGGRIEAATVEAKTAKAAGVALRLRLIEPLSSARPPEPEAQTEPQAPVVAGVVTAKEGTPVVATEPTDASSLKKRRQRPWPLEIAAGISLLTRDLRYSDDLFGQLRPYDLQGAPLARLGFRWYPGAHFTRGLGAHFGVDGRAEIGFGLDSEMADGTTFPTRTSALELSLAGRIPFGVHHVGILAGFGRHGFEIDDSHDGQDPELPSVEYGYLRGGLEARVVLIDSLLAIQGRFGWRQVLASGEIGSKTWFPKESSAGIDGELAVGFEIVRHLEARLGGEIVRYFFSMNPDPGDAMIAGGAIDQQLRGTLTVAYRL